MPKRFPHEAAYHNARKAFFAGRHIDSILWRFKAYLLGNENAREEILGRARIVKQPSLVPRRSRLKFERARYESEAQYRLGTLLMIIFGVHNQIDGLDLKEADVLSELERYSHEEAHSGFNPGPESFLESTKRQVPLLKGLYRLSRLRIPKDSHLSEQTYRMLLDIYNEAFAEYSWDAAVAISEKASILFQLQGWHQDCGNTKESSKWWKKATKVSKRAAKAGCLHGVSSETFFHKNKLSRAKLKKCFRAMEKGSWQAMSLIGGFLAEDEEGTLWVLEEHTRKFVSQLLRVRSQVYNISCHTAVVGDYARLFHALQTAEHFDGKEHEVIAAIKAFLETDVREVLVDYLSIVFSEGLLSVANPFMLRVLKEKLPLFKEILSKEEYSKLTSSQPDASANANFLCKYITLKRLARDQCSAPNKGDAAYEVEDTQESEGQFYFERGTLEYTGGMFPHENAYATAKALYKRGQFNEAALAFFSAYQKGSDAAHSVFFEWSDVMLGEIHPKYDAFVFNQTRQEQDPEYQLGTILMTLGGFRTPRDFSLRSRNHMADAERLLDKLIHQIEASNTGEQAVVEEKEEESELDAIETAHNIRVKASIYLLQGLFFYDREENYLRAREAFQKSAELGNPQAMVALADMESSGILLERPDYAAHPGHGLLVSTQFGSVSEESLDITQKKLVQEYKDFYDVQSKEMRRQQQQANRTAQTLYQQAARLGNPRAMNSLNMLEQASELGHSAAMGRLSWSLIRAGSETLDMPKVSDSIKYQSLMLFARAATLDMGVRMEYGFSSESKYYPKYMRELVWSLITDREDESKPTLSEKVLTALRSRARRAVVAHLCVALTQGEFSIASKNKRNTLQKLFDSVNPNNILRHLTKNERMHIRVATFISQHMAEVIRPTYEIVTGPADEKFLKELEQYPLESLSPALLNKLAYTVLCCVDYDSFPNQRGYLLILIDNISAQAECLSPKVQSLLQSKQTDIKVGKQLARKVAQRIPSVQAPCAMYQKPRRVRQSLSMDSIEEQEEPKVSANRYSA